VLLIVFTISMFVSATLLFLVEPMLAKMALPLLGGAPAVWNTCLVFFQATLLAGYLYAYAATKWLSRRTQIALQIALALMPFAVLPLHIPVGWEPPTESSPVLWVLAMLAVAVGLPFFVLASSTPMLQRWFSQSGHKSASDPYFLYAASNAGSLVGLLAYPLILEPTLRLSVQSSLWSWGYTAFLVLTAACGVLVWRAKSGVAAVQAAPQEEDDDADCAATCRQRLRWIALAFVPSSLMMGVTTALTTDVPAIPLIWVLPLAFYLLSFVLVFAKRPPIPHEWLIRRLPFLMLLSLLAYVSKIYLPLMILFPLYLLTLFAVAMMCHGELALGRPKVSRLTEFYLWISLGGVLGGIFNSLVAPLIFSTVFEFPLVLIFAAALKPPVDQNPATSTEAARSRRNDLLLPLVLALCAAAVFLGVAHGEFLSSSILKRLTVVAIGCLVLLCMSFGKRPIRFAAGLAVLLAAGLLYTGTYGPSLHTERNFFGALRVTNSPNGKFRYLIHGGTIHGAQSLDSAQSREPLAYYTSSGPAGSILRAMQAKTLYGSAGEARKASWAVVGLGAGAMACYLQPGESLTYYEIDPLVERVALNPNYFTYLQQCAPAARIVLGDARLQLRAAPDSSPDSSYDLIVLDAFSGDMIPMHLMTREALALYMRKLAPGGMMAFHISNLYLQLGPTFGALAQDSGLVCLMMADNSLTQAQSDAGKLPSRWVVMARSRADLGALATDPRWMPVNVPPGTQVWTDDYSNLLRVIRWK
jgi:hypothetical protein